MKGGSYDNNLGEETHNGTFIDIFRNFASKSRTKWLKIVSLYLFFGLTFKPKSYFKIDNFIGMFFFGGGGPLLDIP